MDECMYVDAKDIMDASTVVAEDDGWMDGWMDLMGFPFKVNI